MCGIAGAFRAGGLSPELVRDGVVDAMTDALTHRGPDARGIRAVGGTRPFAILGARRLAILDLEHGDQPVSDAHDRFVVSMNGEVYNHRSLHKQLAAQGHAFRGHGDTELVAVMLAANPHAPARTLERLHGMFALGIADVAARRVLLVRDRMGQKPVYWTQLRDGTVAWASEPRALLALPGFRPVEDRRSLQAVLLFEYVPTPWSCWQGVHKLPPGSMLIADADGVRIETWWQPPVPRAGRSSGLGRWPESLRNALQLATVQRLDADVEIGCLLSGGLDSSTVAALASARLDRPLRTFSLSVDATGFDEGAHARRVAAHLGTEHRAGRLTPDDLLPTLDAIGAHMDEPLADSSLIATWKLMELVRGAGLKCVLSGDGADESFAGYPTYLAHRLAPVAAPGGAVLAAAVARLPTTHEGVTRDYMARRFVQGLRGPDGPRPWAHMHQVWMGAWLPEELTLAPDFWQVVDDHARAAQDTDAVSRAMYLDQRLYLADGVLVKVDRASMAHGVEVRSPFLDHSIVELAADMSRDLKLSGRTTKRVLKAVARELLPADIVDRRKQGFGTPVGPWLRGPLTHLLHPLPELLADLVSPELLRRCITEHRDGTEDHRRRLWAAVCIARWRQRNGA
ncbi:MAG: asparagine synthase (glutamine-hydrolyzing) [Alphaproteobacteria bacterium]|nr:asparagine synthase (glutamine-hydrolyzing) [Alphaproteobacteria bacterium]